MKNLCANVLRLITCSALLALSVHSQTSTASLTGRIADPTDAPVAGAPIRVTNMDTGIARETVSSGTGNYTVPLLEPGRYQVSVAVSGFKQSTRAGITLQVDQVARVDIALELGATSENVLVQATAPILDFETSSLGQVVENRQVTELPVNGRNTLAFLSLTPGIRLQGQAGVNQSTTSVQNRGNFSANGGLANANNVLVEGTSVNIARGNIVAFIPPVDATEEFRVETNNYSAEYGRSSGAVVNLSIKSGTNGLHGTLYEFFRNRDLDANNFFQNKAGLPRPALSFNQYGASVGGPIRKDKFFFFANFEGFNQRQGTALTTTVPTALQRTGDFSQTFNAAGQLISIANPFSTRLGPDGKTFIRDSFSGNVIPPALLNPVGVKFTNFFYPPPNQPGAPFTNVNNWSGSASQPIDSYQGVGRLDYTLNARWKLFATYAQQYIHRGKLDLFHNGTAPAISGYTEMQTDNYAVVSATAILKPNLVAELRTSFIRFGHHRYPPNYPFDLTSLGFPAALQNAEEFQGFPTVTVAGLQGASVVGGSTILSVANNWNQGGSLSWIHGNHTTKFGGLFTVQQANDLNISNPTPAFNFTGQFTSTNPAASTATSGVGLASLLLGVPATGNASYSLPLADQRWYMNVFVQDDWKATRRLTLNLGLQYSLDSSITERYNRISWFDPNVVPPIAAQVGLPLHGALVFGDKDHRYPENLYRKQWAPRVGFAYQLFPKTVVRGGYGIFWLPNNLEAVSTGTRASAWTTTTTFVGSLNGGITPQDTLSNPFPNSIQFPPGSANGANSLIGQAISVYLRSNHTAYVQQFNFDIQQELWKDIVLDVAYAGSKSTGLPVEVDLNQLPDQYLSLGSALQTQVPNPFYPLVKAGILASPTVARGQLLRPYPQFGSVLAQGANAGSGTYHSLQAKITKRFSSSVILASYTYSKAIGNSEAANSVSQEVSGEPGSGQFSNNYNHLQDRSLAEFDAPQRFVLSYTVDLPFGKGRAFLNGGGLVNRLIGGWQLTGIYTYQSGTPLFISNVTNTLASAFVFYVRPNTNGQTAKLSGSGQSRLNQWFNTSTYSSPAPFTYGNVSRTLPDVRNDHTNNFDTGFYKNNRFGHDGRFNLQFRTEFFNVFNRVRFSDPGLVFGTAQFGVVSAQANSPRQVQFALKLLF